MVEVMDMPQTQNTNNGSQISKIVLDMEAISLLTSNNWIFSRFDIDERFYIFHLPESGEKTTLSVIGDDDMFISYNEMLDKIPGLQSSIDKISFTSITTANLDELSALKSFELALSHPDDLEHDLFFITFATLNFINGGGGITITSQDNQSDAIYDLKRYIIERVDASDNIGVRFHHYWQNISPYLEIFMTHAANVSIQEQLIKIIEDEDDYAWKAMETSLFNLFLAMAEKAGIKIDKTNLEVGNCHDLSIEILANFKNKRFFRPVMKESALPENQTKEVSGSYYQKLKDPANYPVPNKKALEVYFLACQGDTDYAELTELIKEDPVLTAKILKLLNTPMFRTVNTISSISIEALSVFGLQRIKEMALNVAVDFRDFEIQCPAFNYDEFYQNSLACAIATRNITGYVNSTKPEDSLFTSDEAYTVGLLSQMGKLAFAAVCPQEYNRILNDAADTGEKLCQEEQKEFGINHCEITAEMLKDWGFPDSFCKAIRYQYDYPVNNDIFDDDNVASAFASKLKTAGFTLRWSRTISSTLQVGKSMEKQSVIKTLNKGIDEYNICPGNYHKQALETHKEWKNIKSALDI